jgi:hypothetical protein
MTPALNLEASSPCGHDEYHASSPGQDTPTGYREVRRVGYLEVRGLVIARVVGRG